MYCECVCLCVDEQYLYLFPGCSTCFPADRLHRFTSFLIVAAALFAILYSHLLSVSL